MFEEIIWGPREFSQVQWSMNTIQIHLVNKSVSIIDEWAIYRCRSFNPARRLWPHIDQWGLGSFCNSNNNNKDTHLLILIQKHAHMAIIYLLAVGQLVLNRQWQGRYCNCWWNIFIDSKQKGGTFGNLSNPTIIWILLRLLVVTHIHWWNWSGHVYVWINGCYERSSLWYGNYEQKG